MKFNRRNRDRHESSSGLARPHLNWNSAIKTMIADDEQKNRSYSFQHLKTRFPDMRGLADSINRGVFHVVNYTMNKCLLLLKKKEKKRKKRKSRLVGTRHNNSTSAFHTVAVEKADVSENVN